MTVKMSSEGDSPKKLSSESTEKSEAENTDSSQDAKDAKTDATAENSVEKKEEDSKPEESDESDKKTESNKTTGEKVENDVKSSNDNKKEAKSKAKDDEDDEESAKDEDESENDDEDNEKDVPLLDQPLEKSGKRERKNVQRFKEDVPPETKEVEFPSGSGTALGNIPRVDASISRFKNDDMKFLHKLLFKSFGKSTMVKKNIKKFNGFEFKKDSEEYNKKVATIQKNDVKQLKSICEMLDLQKSGSKDDIIERILDFLLEPKDSGKAVVGGRPKRTAAVRANNRGYSSHDNYSSDERHSGRTGRAKGRRSNLKDDSSSASDEDFEPSDDGSDEKPRVTKRKRSDRKKADSDDDDDVSDVESASSEDSDFQDEPKTKRRKSVVKANNKTKGKATGKRGRPAGGKKTAKVGKKKKESSEDEEEEDESDKKGDESSSEDEPLAKKASKSAQPPTDDEIKTYVKEILEGANLEQITMKTVCQQVYAHYPDFDLVHKKDFIKSTVKSLIST